MAARLRLDHPGIAEVLKSAPVASLIELAAESVASNVDEHARDGQPIRVLVETYTTDRAAAAVTMAHPAGLPIEAKRGSLARAASAYGLEVTARSSS